MVLGFRRRDWSRATRQSRSSFGEWLNASQASIRVERIGDLILADQPVSFLDFDEDDEISAREFESARKKAREATGYPV